MKQPRAPAGGRRHLKLAPNSSFARRAPVGLRRLKQFGLDRFEPESDDCIVTSAYHRDRLDEVIWNAFYASCSCERFDACRDTILVVFEDGDPRINELKAMCSSLESRLDIVLARDDDGSE